MKSTAIENLEKIAKEYHESEDVPDKFIENICQEHCCKWLKSLIEKDDSVIELGYGDGITLANLVNCSKNYTVLEGAPTLAKKIRDKFPTVETVEGLFENYNPKNGFDKVLALHVLEHVNDPVHMLKHLRGWLKPNADLIVIVPNKESLHRRLAVKMGLIPKLDTLSDRDHLVGHQRVYSLNELKQDLFEAGFECLEIKGFFLKLLPNSMMLSYTTSLIDGLNLIGDDVPVEMSANIGVRARIINE